MFGTGFVGREGNGEREDGRQSFATHIDLEQTRDLMTDKVLAEIILKKNLISITEILI